MKTYRFQIKVENALDFLNDKFARSLDLSENIISGWIKEGMINELKNHFKGLDVKLIENYK